jgi:hypothetical protein
MRNGIPENKFERFIAGGKMLKYLAEKPFLKSQKRDAARRKVGRESAEILTETFMTGLPLVVWIKTGPSRKHRDAVADTLDEIFFKNLYELHCIHADPNPGNFIIAEDGSIRK